jgi:hypothetical protein
MIPLVGGIMVASIVSGQLTSRTGRYKVFPVIGLGLMTVGMLLFHFLLHADTPYWQTAAIMVVFGLGLGNCMQTLVLAVQNAVPASDMGVATASATFFRQMGGTVGVSVFLSILFSTVGGYIASAFRSASATPSFQAALADPSIASNPVNAPAVNPATGVIQVVQDSSVLQRMDPRLAEPFLQGYSQSMDLVFLVAACVIFVGFVLIWFLTETPLRTTSGIQARQAEEAAAGTGPGSVDSAAEITGPARGALDVPVSAPPVGAAGAAGSDRLVEVVRSNGARTAQPSPAPRPAGHGRHEAPEVSGRRGDSVVLGTLADAADRGTGRDTGHDDAGRAVDGALAGVPMALHALDGTVVDRTSSAADGSFRLHAPMPGSYVVLATPGVFRPHAELVALEGTPVRRRFALRRATPVGGSVRDAEDVPVVGASVTVTDGAGGVRAVRRTGVDGTWECPELESGTYTVVVLAPGREPVAERLVVDEATPAGRRTTRHDVRVPVVRHEVRGRVLSASGRTVPESLVVLMGADGRVVASTVTDGDGRFAVGDLTEGRYLLTASGYAPVTAQVSVARDAQEPVELVVEPPQPASSAPVPAAASSVGTFERTEPQDARRPALDAETTPLPVAR